MLIVKPVDEQLDLIRRGAEQITPEADLRRKLERSVRTGKPLRVKYGIDPTGIDVHLGHTVALRSCVCSRNSAIKPFSSSATTPPSSATPAAAIKRAPASRRNKLRPTPRIISCKSARSST